MTTVLVDRLTEEQWLQCVIVFDTIPLKKTVIIVIGKLTTEKLTRAFRQLPK